MVPGPTVTEQVYSRSMFDSGLFGPGSVTWRVSKEGVLLLGGGRALIMQVAHPLVAAGVAEHSDYQEDPWGRLYRTLELMTRIAFGDTPTAEAAIARLHKVHSRVRGVTRESAGRFPRGTRYEAGDPALLMWVHATLVDTSLLVYEHSVGPLSLAERQRYYAEQQRWLERLGVPLELQPATYADFNEYVDTMIESDRIAVTDTLREVVDATLRPPLPPPARPLVEALNLVTVGLLPARLRQELGLGWGPRREAALGAASRALRRTLPLLPARVRELPPARRAKRRAAAAA
jgi:uncharacterized protein (DUF2236 family)